MLLQMLHFMGSLQEPLRYYPQYYRPAPRVVVVERPVYANTGVGIVLGAIAGAVIAHELSR
jgi:hypothetical protein